MVIDMTKFRGTYMTKEEYINWLIENIKIETKHFVTAHFPELKMHYCDLIEHNQQELVSLGYTWEQVEEIATEAMKAA